GGLLRRSLEQLDLIPRSELDDRLLPAPGLAGVDAAALRLRAHPRGPDPDDFDVEDLGDRMADLGLVGAVVDAERVLALRHQRIALLGDDRFEDDLARIHQSSLPSAPSASPALPRPTAPARASSTSRAPSE